MLYCGWYVYNQAHFDEDDGVAFVLGQARIEFRGAAEIKHLGTPDLDGMRAHLGPVQHRLDGQRLQLVKVDCHIAAA